MSRLTEAEMIEIESVGIYKLKSDVPTRLGVFPVGGIGIVQGFDDPMVKFAWYFPWRDLHHRHIEISEAHSVTVDGEEFITVKYPIEIEAVRNYLFPVTKDKGGLEAIVCRVLATLSEREEEILRSRFMSFSSV